MKKMLFLSTIIVVLTLCIIPGTAFFADAMMTAEEEKKLGHAFMRHIRKNLELIEDPSIQGYVKEVGDRIVSYYPTSPFDIQFYVVKEDVYNAFAGPAGHVFINSGLLAAMENEDQLAGILGHELGHVYARHIAKRIEQAKKINVATLAGVLAGAFLGGSSAAMSAITTTTLAAGQSVALAHSREAEMEADQLGLKYFTKAGYNGVALLAVLNKLREKTWFGSQHVPTYLQTHPALEARMAYLDTWIQIHPEWKSAETLQNQQAFDKINTKLIALYSDPQKARHAFDATLRKNPTDALTLYGMGMLLDRQGDSDAAVDMLQKAVSQRPFDGDMLRELGKVQFHMGDYAGALIALRGALTLQENDLEGRFLLARVQAMTHDEQSAIHTLEALLADVPTYLPAMHALGEAYGKQGDLVEAHYNLGRYYNGKGAEKNARFHLSRALELSAHTPEKKEKIHSELKKLSQHKREEKK